MSDHRLPSSSAVQATTGFSNRRLTPGEFQAYVDAPVSEAEREEALRLIRWFKKRYPTPAERLAYARRSYTRWRAADLGVRRR
jgi:hypothetical protein